MQALTADWESGDSVRSVCDRGFDWLKELPQYHGGDKRSERPFPTNSVNLSEMMRTREEEIKGDLSPSTHSAGTYAETMLEHMLK